MVISWDHAMHHQPQLVPQQLLSGELDIDMVEQWCLDLPTQVGRKDKINMASGRSSWDLRAIRLIQEKMAPQSSPLTPTPYSATIHTDSDVQVSSSRFSVSASHFLQFFAIN